MGFALSKNTAEKVKQLLNATPGVSKFGNQNSFSCRISGVVKIVEEISSNKYIATIEIYDTVTDSWSTGSEECIAIPMNINVDELNSLTVGKRYLAIRYGNVSTGGTSVLSLWICSNYKLNCLEVVTNIECTEGVMTVEKKCIKFVGEIDDATCCPSMLPTEDLTSCHIDNCDCCQYANNGTTPVDCCSWVEMSYNYKRYNNCDNQNPNFEQTVTSKVRFPIYGVGAGCGESDDLVHSGGFSWYDNFSGPGGCLGFACRFNDEFGRYELYGDLFTNIYDGMGMHLEVVILIDENCCPLSATIEVFYDDFLCLFIADMEFNIISVIVGHGATTIIREDYCV